MGAIESQITNLTIVYSTVYSGADQSSASLAFVRGIHRWPVNYRNKWPVTRKMFSFNDVIMLCGYMTSLGHIELKAHIYESWYVSLEWDFIYLLLFLASVHGFMHETSDFLLYNNLFAYQVLCTLIYRRRSPLLFLISHTIHMQRTT